MKPCNNPKCCSSSGICGSTTHGWGILSHNGYWQYPCFTCARYYDDVFGEIQYPFPDTPNEPLESVKVKCKCGVEVEYLKEDGPPLGSLLCDECWEEHVGLSTVD